ncbi:MAG TPA: hypothetical protein VGG39_26845 [Polyangiaceae bacterium]|jgi:hypothetical protein
MADEKAPGWLADSAYLREKAWVAPTPDPDADLRREAHSAQALWHERAYQLGAREPPPATFEQRKAARDAERAAAKRLADEVQTSAAEHELARRDLEAGRAAIADLEKKIRVAETKRRREDYAEHSRQVDTLARQRATDKGRAAVTAKDRAWAAERIAKGGP